MTAAIFFEGGPVRLDGAFLLFTIVLLLVLPDGGADTWRGVVPESWTVINTSQLEGTIPCVRTV